MRDVEVGGREVGEAQRGGLVRDAERVAEVLDRDVAIRLRLPQELDRLRARHQARRPRSS